MIDDKKPGPEDATETPDARIRDAARSHMPADAAPPDLTGDAQAADPLAEVSVTGTDHPQEAVGEEAEGPRPASPPDLSSNPIHDDPARDDAARNGLAGEEPVVLEEPLARAAEEAAAKPARDTVPDSAPHPMPTSSMSQPKGSGFLPTLAGGMIAAALGGGVAWYLLSHQMPPPPPAPDNTINSRLNDQAGEISVLKSEIARLAAAPAPAVPEDLVNRIGALQQALDEARAQGDSLASRLSALEQRPAPAEGGALPDDLEATIRAQAERNDQLSAAFDQLRTATERQISEATAQGTRAAQDAILARIAMAVIAGESYAPLLQQAEGVGLAIPDGLRAHAGGVPDEPSLKAAFPAAARAALDAATLADAQGAAFSERASAFLRNQLGVRSLAPREGTSPDAVLSRMQADVEAGDFAAALAEAEALPPQGRAAMQDWLDGATARVAALKDIEGLQARIAE